MDYLFQRVKKSRAGRIFAYEKSCFEKMRFVGKSAKNRHFTV